MIRVFQTNFKRWSFLNSCYQVPLNLVRKFSLQDASSALRPFYFMVHPDFFGQYPAQRSVNENSLKLLNEYLASYNNQRKWAKPKEIPFYIREEGVVPYELRLVKIHLDNKTLRETVLAILRACSLSEGHVAEEAKPGYGANRPIDWHPSYYEATGKKNPHAHPPSKTPVLSLRSWLHQNIDQVRVKTDAVKFIKDDIQRLLEKLKHDLSLHSISCNSVWGLHNFRGCLKSFNRLCEQEPEFVRDVLKDRSLVFSNCTGVSRTGEIILSGEDVPEYWYMLLMSVAAYDDVLLRLPKLEEKLSMLLNGIRIIRKEKRHGSMMAEEYELVLNKLINTLRRCQGYVKDELQDQDLSSLHLIVDGEASPLTLSSSGQFLIPASIPGFLLVDFIKKHQSQALSLLTHMQQLMKEEKEKRQEAIEALHLSELQNDESVSTSQMISCCSRLIEQGWMLVGSLSGCRVRVSHYYSVMQDGLICLPWDWVGSEDE